MQACKRMRQNARLPTQRPRWKSPCCALASLLTRRILRRPLGMQAKRRKGSRDDFAMNKQGSGSSTPAPKAAIVFDDGFGAKAVMEGAWSWMLMARRIGGEAAVERIVSQSSTIGVLAALLGALAFTGLSAPPESLVGSDPSSRGFIISIGLSALFNLCSVMVSSHIIIHLNTIEWDTESVARALEKNSSHLVVSIVQGSLFLVGLVFLFIGICFLVYRLYDEVVFYTILAFTIALVIVGFWSIRTIAVAMLVTHAERRIEFEQEEAAEKEKEKQNGEKETPSQEDATQ